MSTPLSRETCSLCPSLASVCCNCALLPTFLCYSCIGRHNQKFPHFPHPTAPINSRHSDYGNLCNKTAIFTDRKAKAAQILSRIDACIQEVTTGVDQFIGRLIEYRDRKKGELQRGRAALEQEIQSASEKVMATLGQDVRPSDSVFESYLRGAGTDDHVAFRYTLNIPALEHCLDTLLTVETFQQSFTEGGNQRERDSDAGVLPGQRVMVKEEQIEQVGVGITAVLPCLWGDKLRFFDFQTMRWGPATRLPDSISCGNECSYTLIDDNRLFCSGNLSPQTQSPSKRLAFLIDRSGNLTELPKLLRPRCCHGSLSILNSLYLFGGSDPSGETLSFTDPSQWNRLPEMSEDRKCFNPVLYERLILLIGGGCKAVDIYQLDCMKMKRGVVALPTDSRATTVVQGETIIVITSSYRATLRWKKGAMKVIDITNKKADKVWPSGTPVLVRNRVFVTNRAMCYCFDIDTGALVKEIQI